jgi:hypothetical protein
VCSKENDPLNRSTTTALYGRSIPSNRPGGAETTTPKLAIFDSPVIRTAVKHGIVVIDAQIRAKMTELDLCLL